MERLLQEGSLYIGSFNQSGDVLCLRPSSVCVCEHKYRIEVDKE